MLNRWPQFVLVIAFLGICNLTYAAAPTPTAPPPAPAQSSTSCATDLKRPAVLPDTKYVAQIQNGNVTVIPYGSGQTTPIPIGKINVIKQGTTFVRWHPEPGISRLIGNGLTEENLVARILADPQTDVEGGGLYDSTNAIDSMTYGPAGATTTSTQDLQVVLAGWLSVPDRVDSLVALRNAGIHAIQEVGHPAWFNFIRNEGVRNWRAMDIQTALQMISTLDDSGKELLSLVLFDQRMTIRASDLSTQLPHGQLPIAQLATKLILGQSLSPADLQVVHQSSLHQLFGWFLVRGEQKNLKMTPLFKGYNAAYAKTYNGKSITDLIAQTLNPT